tara:strand:+ start:1822 stop:2238 length:417 start_codon:yes stop_codon:yes gene_type:complete
MENKLSDYLNNIEILQKKMNPNLLKMKEWLVKSKENIEINNKYLFKNKNNNSGKDNDIDIAIKMLIENENCNNNYELKLHYDLCEFPSENTLKINNKNIDTSQQKFMIDFVGSTYNMFLIQQQMIIQMKNIIKEIDKK